MSPPDGDFFVYSKEGFVAFFMKKNKPRFIFYESFHLILLLRYTRDVGWGMEALGKLKNPTNTTCERGNNGLRAAVLICFLSPLKT